MEPQIQVFLNDLKVLLLSDPTVHRVHLRGEEVTATRGYLRIRLDLQSQDVVELFVYLVEQGQAVRLQDYSLHWQRLDRTLVQRWDTAPHHPELTNFPFHTHKPTGEVEATATLDWDGLLALLKKEVLEGSSNQFNA